MNTDERPQEYRPVGASRVTLYVTSTLGLCVLAVIFVIVITIVRPEADNSALITVVLGLLTPIVGALLAGALKEVHTDVNSRLTEFLALTEKAAKAEGQLLGPSATVEPMPVSIVSAKATVPVKIKKEK